MFSIQVTRKQEVLFRKDLVPGCYILGRSKSVDITLPGEEVSRRHAELVVGDPVVKIRDLDSRNGTKVNGVSIASNQLLSAGDRVEIDVFTIQCLGGGEAGLQEEEEDGETRALPMDEFLDPELLNKRKKKKQRQSDVRKVEGGMKYSLVCSKGEHKGETFPVTTAGLSIGRSSAMGVCLSDDGISTQHALVEIKDRLLFIKDMNSTNGVYINGNRMLEAELKNGDRVRIGSNQFKVVILDVQRTRKTLMISVSAFVGVMTLLLLVSALKPEPPEVQLLAQANAHFQKGEYEDARNFFITASKTAPNSREAKQGLQKVNSILGVQEKMKEALAAAQEERYQDAKRIINEVLRQEKGNAEALELAEVFKQIEDAEVAFDAENWAAAVSLYSTAAEKFPSSLLIQDKLDQARFEHSAYQVFGRAKELYEKGEMTQAMQLLSQVPSASRISVEAQTLRRTIEDQRAASMQFVEAKSLFREGNVEAAIVKVSVLRGDKDPEGEAESFHRYLLNIRPLLQRLEQDRTKVGQATTDQLVVIRDNAEEVIGALGGQSSYFEDRAVEVRDTAARTLQSEAATFYSQALSAYNMQNYRDTVINMRKAIQAGIDQQDAPEILKESEEKLDEMCRAIFTDAMMHKRMGFPAEAREKLSRIRDIAVPGERDWQRATEELRLLPK